MTSGVLANVTCVAIDGHGVLIEGPPGSGKSSLALALIDRGAVLIGDDGVMLEPRSGAVWAHPPPNIAGKLEIRGVGIVDMPCASAPLALAITLGHEGERMPTPSVRQVDGVALPQLVFPRTETITALRVEWALRIHGRRLPDTGA